MKNIKDKNESQAAEREVEMSPNFSSFSFYLERFSVYPNNFWDHGGQKISFPLKRNLSLFKNALWLNFYLNQQKAGLKILV